jgi:DNA-binding ferritin-like protein
MSECLRTASISEEVSDVTSFEMAKIIIKDIRALLAYLEDGVDAAREINDNGTEYLLQSVIYNIEQDHWMLASWIKQNV